MDMAMPETIAQAAAEMNCRSVAFTYNDPVIFHEYAIDVAQACRERDIKSVAVTAGYVCPEPCQEFYTYMDAANIDLKAFTDRFYQKITGSHLEPALDTLKYLKYETHVWLETTTLLIPGENDSVRELKKMTQWVVDNLGTDVPMHFSAFHPDWKMINKLSPPMETLNKAREIAIKNGVRYAYAGNVHNKSADSTYCHHCGELLISRDCYVLSDWNLTAEGYCISCDTRCAGVFEETSGNWGAKRVPVKLEKLPKIL